MTCPICGDEVRTTQSVKDCEGVYRKRVCINKECGHIFYTTEIESDGSDFRRLSRERLDDFHVKHLAKKRSKL